MKLSANGIGWLIFGALICASVTEASGWRSALSTLVLGAVFISIYLMKQRFKTHGIGWYICGGVLLAFICDADELSDMFISLVIAAACLIVFYFRNKESVDELIDEIDDGVTGYSPDWIYDENAAAQEAAEAADETADAGSAGETDVEFEIEVKE